MNYYKMINTRQLRKFSIVIAVFWVIAQIVVFVFFQDIEQGNDPKSYISHAMQHYHAGTWYPTKANLYDIYIQALGFVNWLILLFRVFGPSIKAVMVVNIIMNIAILYEIYYLSKKFFSINVAYIAVILYCLITTNTFIPLHISCDLPSLFFILTGFTLALHNKWQFALFGAILLGYSHSIRPYEMAFVVSLIIYYWFHKMGWHRYVLLLIPYVAVIIAIGFYSKVQTGTFVTASTSTNYAMVKIALGDGKTDAGNIIFYDKDNPNYQGLPGKTFAEKDSIWKERAKPGLRKNGLKYLMYWPKRVFNLYKVDSYSVPSLVPADQIKVRDAAKDKKKAQIAFVFWKSLYSLVFFITLFVFAFSMYINRKSIFSEKGLFLLMFFIMSCEFSVLIAEDRYHYPCVFIICIWAAYGIETMRKKKREVTQ